MSNADLLHFLATILAGWVNRHQQTVIDYLMEENRVFKQQLQGGRLQLSDNDRRRLAAKAKALGRNVLDEVANLVTPDTLCAWYRKLISSVKIAKCAFFEDKLRIRDPQVCITSTDAPPKEQA